MPSTVKPKSVMTITIRSRDDNYSIVFWSNIHGTFGKSSQRNVWLEINNGIQFWIYVHRPNECSHHTGFVFSNFKKRKQKNSVPVKMASISFRFFFYSYCLKNSTAASEFPWNLAKYAAGFCSYILRNMYIIAIFMKFLMLSTAVMGRANKLKTRTEFINTSKFISSLYFFMF